MYKGKIFKAIVLAGGSGQRMNASTLKQYIEIKGKPMMVYTLEAFEESPVDEIILVVQAGDEEYCRTEIVDRFGLKKVGKIIAGGRERYHSSAIGLRTAQECDYVLIHDAVRPCLTNEVIVRCMDFVMHQGACTAGIPVVDTINVIDEERKVLETPDRNHLWVAQTPQVFPYKEICAAHEKLRAQEPQMTAEERKAITDDVKVAKWFMGIESYMVEGAYENIKVTTPVDLKIARLFLENR